MKNIIISTNFFNGMASCANVSSYHFKITLWLLSFFIGISFMATNTFTSTQRIILHINNFDELCFFCGPCPCHEQETPRLVKSQHSALDVSCFHVDYFIEYIKRRYRVSGSGVALVLTNSIRHPNRVTTLTSLC